MQMTRSPQSQPPEHATTAIGVTDGGNLLRRELERLCAQSGTLVKSDLRGRGVTRRASEHLGEDGQRVWQIAIEQVPDDHVLQKREVDAGL